MAHYLRLGKTAEFPVGSLRAFQVAGREVAVSNVEGSFYAFGNECTHARAFLTQGEIRDCRIVCTWHWASFDMATGRVIMGPAGLPLPVYGIRTEGDELQIEWPEVLPENAVVAVERY